MRLSDKQLRLIDARTKEVAVPLQPHGIVTVRFLFTPATVATQRSAATGTLVQHVSLRPC